MAKKNPKKDASVQVDQRAVRSKVTVDGAVTVRTYSDGAVQRNVHHSKEAAQEYAASVAQVEGHK